MYKIKTKHVEGLRHDDHRNISICKILENQKNHETEELIIFWLKMFSNVPINIYVYIYMCVCVTISKYNHRC